MKINYYNRIHRAKYQYKYLTVDDLPKPIYYTIALVFCSYCSNDKTYNFFSTGNRDKRYVDGFKKFSKCEKCGTVGEFPMKILLKFDDIGNKQYVDLSGKKITPEEIKIVSPLENW